MLRLLLIGWFLAVLAAPAQAQQSHRDCPHCPEMVRVPTGSFMMGAAPGEHARDNIPADWRMRELPQHEVTIGYAFSLGMYEVTLGEFATFIQATGRQMGNSCFSQRRDGNWEDILGNGWREPGFAQSDRGPVVCVTWNDAKGYVAWLSQTTGKRYRLPTEAEWEYAARAGTATARYWGERHQDACLYANVNDAEHGCRDGHTKTARVGTFQPNAFGLHDMLGNVWEWTEDCWNESYAGAPADGSSWQSGDCSHGVVRGGSWDEGPLNVRAARRIKPTAGTRSSDAGFRVARTD